jgi:hypothetical protein
MRTVIDWRDVLKDFLIEGGTAGRSQADIQRRFRSTVPADMLRNELEVLFVEDKVQKFIVPPVKSGIEKTIWRATDRINEY